MPPQGEQGGKSLPVEHSLGLAQGRMLIALLHRRPMIRTPDDLAAHVAAGIAAKKHRIVHFKSLEKLWPCRHAVAEKRKWSAAIEAFAASKGWSVELLVNTSRAVFRKAG